MRWLLGILQRICPVHGINAFVRPTMNDPRLDRSGNK